MNQSYGRLVSRAAIA
ncbi:hypothetical protein, partial [Klebsiella aerogenes]